MVTADRIVTVSQGYAYEICTPEGGFGLNFLLEVSAEGRLQLDRWQSFLFTAPRRNRPASLSEKKNMFEQNRKHVLNGITNGIDEDEWSPEADALIAANYSAEDLSGKAACKAALQASRPLLARKSCTAVTPPHFFTGFQRQRHTERNVVDGPATPTHPPQHPRPPAAARAGAAGAAGGAAGGLHRAA